MKVMAMITAAVSESEAQRKTSPFQTMVPARAAAAQLQWS